MVQARQIAILSVIISVTVILASGTVAADQVPEPDIGYDTVSEESGDTDLQSTEIGYNEENESVLIRQSFGGKWDKSNQTVVYLDTDQDNTTGISRDFLTDGSAREEYYKNLDFIGADYVAVAGGTAGNATYESTPVELRKVDPPSDDLAVEVNNDNVELAIDTENIEGSDIFDFKVAYVETPDNIISTDNFDFHPDPDNSENRSVTFDTAEGIVGTSVQFNVSNTSEGPGYGEVDVNVDLIDDNGEITDTETLTVSDNSGNNVTFEDLSPTDFDGANSRIEATLATELTNYELTPNAIALNLNTSERASKSAAIEFLSPQVEFNITNGTNTDGVSPFTDEIDYNETGETFSFNITLSNNSNNDNVTIVRNTVEFNRTDRVEINRSDPIDTTGSILQTDVPGSTGVNVSNKNFLDGTGGIEFTVRPEETANGTGMNGTIAQINVDTTTDPGVADPDSVEINHNAIVTTNQTNTFETVIASNTTKINQTFDKVEVANAELVTEQNMVNATLLISATAESPAPNNGKIQNITLYNNSGNKVDNVTCSTPFDSDCSGTLTDTPTKNTSAGENATVQEQYSKTNYTVKAFGTGAPSAYSSDKTNISEKIFVEGDVGSAGRSGVDGNVTLADILIVQNKLGADNGGEFPYDDDSVAGVSDVDNSGSVNGTDLQKVVNEAY